MRKNLKICGPKNAHLGEVYEYKIDTNMKNGQTNTDKEEVILSLGFVLYEVRGLVCLLQ